MRQRLGVAERERHTPGVAGVLADCDERFLEPLTPDQRTQLRTLRQQRR
jgi:hypothetical protein